MNKILTALLSGLIMIITPAISRADSLSVGCGEATGTLSLWMANYDEVPSPLSTPVNPVWSVVEQYRIHGGQGDWNPGGTVTGQNLTDGQYVFVMLPEAEINYETNNLTVNDVYFTFWWHEAVIIPVPASRIILQGP